MDIKEKINNIKSSRMSGTEKKLSKLFSKLVEKPNRKSNPDISFYHYVIGDRVIFTLNVDSNQFFYIDVDIFEYIDSNTEFEQVGKIIKKLAKNHFNVDIIPVNIGTPMGIKR